MKLKNICLAAAFVIGSVPAIASEETQQEEKQQEQQQQEQQQEEKQEQQQEQRQEEKQQEEKAFYGVELSDKSEAAFRSAVKSLSASVVEWQEATLAFEEAAIADQHSDLERAAHKLNRELGKYNKDLLKVLGKIEAGKIHLASKKFDRTARHHEKSGLRYEELTTLMSSYDASTFSNELRRQTLSNKRIHSKVDARYTRASDLNIVE